MEEIFRFYDNPQTRAVAATAGLLLPRILPVVIFTPIFGGNVLPRRLRFGICLMFVMLLLPAAAMQGNAYELTAMQYMAFLAKEIIIGVTLYAIILIMYQTFVAFGAVLDVARGTTIANIFDPSTQQQQSLFGTFFLQTAIVLFLTIGGAHVVIEAWADSLTRMPVFEMLPARLVGQAAAVQVLSLVGDLFVVALQLSMPAFVVLVLLDIVLGVLNKVAPQIQVFLLGLTIKSTLGVLMVFLSLGVTWTLFGEFFVDMMNTLRQWIVLGR